MVTLEMKELASVQGEGRFVTSGVELERRLTL